MNPSTPPALRLPPVFEPEWLEHVDCIAEAGLERLRAGAEEGTLLWSERQQAGRARHDKSWESPDRGLYAALLLRPDEDAPSPEGLALVATVALGSAIAALSEPMTDLRYRWPNAIRVGGTRIAGVWLHRAPDCEGLVLSLACNVSHPPEALFDAGCLREESGNASVTPTDVLEQFAREFLSWINRWAEDGMRPVTRQLLSRHDPVGTPLAFLETPEEPIAGAFEGLDEAGNLQLTVNEKRRTVTIRRFLGF
ncbi:MAG: biotin/lipoate--protein ligase family protein [Wenzhouxiangellaceae bacterium]|nr:biotin/lipoate--protein ligase family protein [Wenzhouxiangellaceae bacterium]